MRGRPFARIMLADFAFRVNFVSRICPTFLFSAPRHCKWLHSEISSLYCLADLFDNTAKLSANDHSPETGENIVNRYSYRLRERERESV